MTPEKIQLGSELRKLRSANMISLHKLSKLSGFHFIICEKAERGNASHATIEHLINTINNKNISDKLCDCGRNKGRDHRLCTRCYKKEGIK